MYPYFLFQVPLIGQLSIPAYSLFAFIGLFFAMVFFYLRLQKKNIAFSRFLILMALLASGDNRHSGSGEKRQFWSTENSHLQFE